MKCIFQYLKPYYFRMLGGLIIKILGTLADLGLPWVLAYILDDVILHGNILYVVVWGCIMFLLAFIARIFNIIANRMASKVARDTTKRLRHDSFEKICYLSGAQVDQFTIPSLISRITSDSYNIHLMIGMMQRFGVRAPIILIGGIVLTSTLDWALTLVLVATLPLLALVIYYVSKKGIPMYTATQHNMDVMIQTIREAISGIRVIKALSKTEHEKKRFSQNSDDVSRSEMRAGMVMALSSPLMNLLLNVGLAVVVIVGAYRVNAGQMQPGKIIAFLSYFTMILNAMMMMNRLFVVYSKAGASAKRIRELLETEKDLIIEQDIVKDFVSSREIISKNMSEHETTGQEVSDNLTQDIYQSTYFIEFNNVSFSYSKEEDKYCIKDVSFQLKKGESLGIIGSTGSGKTTIVNLLMRFYDVNCGSIKIGGRSIKTYPLETLRGMFGTVFQNDVIFAKSLYENISFGRDLSKEEVKQAAKRACADEFIQEKEDTYEFIASAKGANLSGGQKQRILIARALANYPPILILDDSSSALDYRTDAKLREYIRNDFPGTTVITIAQRVSSVMHMDRVLVLEDGEAIGYGTHEELLDNCSIYREIFESQMGGVT